MAEWLKANGGPAGFVMVGIALSFAFWPLGVALIVIGILLWLNASPRVPWKVVRDRDLMASGTLALDDALPRRVEDKVIRISELPPWVYGRVFERCEIRGPTPALISPSERTRVRWLGPTDESFVVVTDLTKLPSGAIRFIECSFVDCELQQFTAVGTREQITALRDEFQPD